MTSFSASISPWAATLPLFRITTCEHVDSISSKDMRRDEDVDVFFRGDVLDEVQDLDPALRVEVARRLVEEKELRVVDERLGQLQPLFHPGRIGLEQAVAGFAEADIEKDVMGPFHRFLARHPRKLAEIGGERHGVHAGDEAIVLGHVADEPPDRELVLADVVAEDRAFAVGRA